MYIEINIQLVLIVWALLVAIVTTRCPDTNLLYPCECSESTNSLMCIKNSDQNFNGTYGLQKVFTAISQQSGDSSRKHFDQLILTNTDSREYGPEMLANLTFKRVFIYENQLIRIHSELFTRTADTVTEIYINALSLTDSPADGYSLFRALASLVNAETVRLDLGIDSLTEIPAHAFNGGQQRQQQQTRLRELAISGTINTIGDYAFEAIPNLRKLRLMGNQLLALGNYSLVFRKSPLLSADNSSSSSSSSSEELELDLSYNKLSAQTIAPGALSHVNRPVNINLDNNQIRFLDESVFGPLVTADDDHRLLTRLSINNNWLNCSDCRSYWLLDYRSTLESRIVGAQCRDSPAHTLWTHPWTLCGGINSTTISTGTGSLAIPNQLLTMIILIVVYYYY